uniref:Uncharacterized protein n=1 Tax=Anguilla anguilla TaxID=7936 RepID=A0A0E9THP0_ANGAN
MRCSFGQSQRSRSSACLFAGLLS